MCSSMSQNTHSAGWLALSPQAWIHHGDPASANAPSNLQPGKLAKDTAFVEFNQTTECCVPTVAMTDVVRASPLTGS